jgi:hypothetical protein
VSNTVRVVVASSSPQATANAAVVPKAHPNPAQRDVWYLRSLRFKRTGGTAANYQLYIGEANNTARDSVGMVVGYSSDAVANGINETFAAPIPCSPDVDGKLWVFPTFDTGTDNTFECVLFLSREP